MPPEPRKPVIVVIGSLNYDLVSVVRRLPNAGETLTSESFSTNPGGKGANQAVAAARIAFARSAGPDVEMIGAVGDDDYGSKIVQGLQHQGVGTNGVWTHHGTNTGVAVIIVEKDTGENRIMLDPGANGTVELLTHPQASIPGCLFDPITRPDLIVMQLEIPLDTVLGIIHQASSSCVPVLLNPAPAQELPLEIYPKIEILVVNESESAILSGVNFQTPASDSQRDDSVLSKAREALAWFVEKGSRHVVITLGALGAVFHEHEQPASSLPRSTSTTNFRHIPAAPVTKVVDTTAAGDTFVGALAVSYVAQKRLINYDGPEGVVAAGGVKEPFSLELAVKQAVRASAWTVQKRGTWEAMPNGLPK
ncbi:hypothetical protein FRB94_009995 [Tulasnella sp. JGI-2019a]|nr:hypothetical protein FRB93_011084 [Tulasnella sp. JGI-2019a]KAG9010719.1 hypothetical protein FRB94_009995 [Tulasnella sp. JGI-2019a]KAG9028603.1 hypothetical protein FRB95_006281 [Tulasnella sp. JGI-2019a]